MSVLISGIVTVLISFIGSSGFFDSLFLAPFVLGLISAIVLMFKHLMRTF